MGRASSIEQSVGHIARLRRAERIPEAAPDVVPARRHLEAEVGPTLSRAMAARVLGVSQTALDRWIAAGALPTVISPRGRVEVPRRVAVELLESIEQLKREGIGRHHLATALRRRRAAAEETDPLVDDLAAHAPGGSERRPPRDHETAERRSLAYHRVIANRLDEQVVDEARRRLDELRTRAAIHPVYEQIWRELLGRSIAEIAQAITADTQAARDLRQNSPFAGVLNDQERLRIVDRVR